MGCGGSKPESSASESNVTFTLQAEAAPRRFTGAHDDMANSVAACGPGEWLSCAEDKIVALTDWRGGRVLQTWRGHERGVNRVLALPSIDGAISASRDTTVKLWKRGEATAAATLTGHELGVSAIAAADDGLLALSGSRDSSLRLWDLPTASLANRCHVSRNVVTCLQWVPGEAQLVAQGSEDLRLRLWDVRALTKPTAILEGYIYFPLAVDCSGPYVVTGSNGFDSVGCEVRVWDRRTNKQVHELTGHEQSVTGLCLLKGGVAAGGGGGAASERLYAASGCKDGEVRLWDVHAGGACLAKLKLSEGVTSVASAIADEGDAKLYVGTTAGKVHAVTVEEMAAWDGGEEMALRVVATGGGDE